VPGIGLADSLEMASVPQQADITNAIRSLASEQP
jgi:2-oxoisovalerate dehydrogenase E1 component beta subunit